MENNETPEIKIENLKPIGKIPISIGALPASYAQSLSYEEQLLWMCNYMETVIIPNINNTNNAVSELQNLYVNFTSNIKTLIEHYKNDMNNNFENFKSEIDTQFTEFTNTINTEFTEFKTEITEDFTELKNYVDNYFENLDITTEISQKIDELMTDGKLNVEVRKQFLNHISSVLMTSGNVMRSVANDLAKWINGTSGAFVYGGSYNNVTKPTQSTAQGIINQYPNSGSSFNRLIIFIPMEGSYVMTFNSDFDVFIRTLHNHFANASIYLLPICMRFSNIASPDIGIASALKNIINYEITTFPITTCYYYLYTLMDCWRQNITEFADIGVQYLTVNGPISQFIKTGQKAERNWNVGGIIPYNNTFLWDCLIHKDLMCNNSDFNDSLFGNVLNLLNYLKTNVLEQTAMSMTITNSVEDGTITLNLKPTPTFAGVVITRNNETMIVQTANIINKNTPFFAKIQFNNLQFVLTIQMKANSFNSSDINLDYIINLLTNTNAKFQNFNFKDNSYVC